MNDDYIKPDELIAKKSRFDTIQFRQEYLVKWVFTHDNVPCEALKLYESQADWVRSPAKLMHEIATNYGTTIEEMKKHWPCIRGEEYY